jgi:selenocysteine lyase/cysteine desulfurase
MEHLELEQMMGGYAAEDSVQRELDAVYEAVALLVNAQKHEIAIVDSATTAWVKAFYSIRFASGDVVLTSEGVPCVV